MKVPSWRVWTIALLLLSLSVAAGQPLVTAAPAATGTLDQLVGSWAVEVTVVQQDAVFPSLITFTSDGLVLADEPPMPFETTGHGAWVATGPDSADFTFVALIGSESGALSAKIKVTGSLTMDAAADTWAGPFKIQVVDADGAEVLADTGTFTGTRIAVETAAPAALQPGDQIGEMVLAKGPDAIDLNVPPYSAFCNANPQFVAGSNVAKPGVYTVVCSVPPVPELEVGFGWVTDNQELLERHWAAIQTELYVNGQPVDQAAFGQLDGSIPVSGIPGEDPNKVIEMPLRLWNVALKDLQSGQFELRQVWHVGQELADSTTTMPAGVYDLTYKITVDPTLAASEGEPAPIELVQQGLQPGDQIGEMTLAQGPDPFDLNLPAYPAFCNPNPMLDPGSTVAVPGEYTVECSMPVLPQVLIGYGTTARTEELLDAVWDATTSEVYVNGELVDQSAFGALDADVPVTGMPGQDPNEVLTLKLRVWNVFLEKLTAGPLALRVVWHISQEVADGDLTWPAGDYDVTYKVTVDPSMPLPEGVPAPIELVQ